MSDDSHHAGGSGSLLSFIERTYGKPMDAWLTVVDGRPPEDDDARVSALVSEHGLTEEEARAVVAHHAEQRGGAR